jgi:hypothetical protein
MAHTAGLCEGADVVFVHSGSEARVEYWVYENWVIRKAVIHRGDCGYCNNGVGVHGGGRTPNGQWRGPFATVREAHNKARQTGQPPRGCKVCAPPLSSTRARTGRPSCRALEQTDLDIPQRA